MKSTDFDIAPHRKADERRTMFWLAVIGAVILAIAFGIYGYVKA